MTLACASVREDTLRPSTRCPRPQALSFFVIMEKVSAFVPDPTLEYGGVECGESMTGVIRWFNADKGYGRVNGDDGYVYFVHYSNLENVEADGYRVLERGARVTFEWHGLRTAHRRKQVVYVRLSGDGGDKPATSPHICG